MERWSAGRAPPTRTAAPTGRSTTAGSLPPSASTSPGKSLVSSGGNHKENLFTKVWDFWQLANYKPGSFLDLRFPCTIRLAFVFLSHSWEGRGLDEVSLSFLSLVVCNLSFLLCFLTIIYEIDSKQLKFLMRLQILKILTTNQKSKTFVKCLGLPKRSLGLWDRKP